ncbi:MAG: DUF4347 domain-containing protein [Thalassobaculaceae bacterium]
MQKAVKRAFQSVTAVSSDPDIFPAPRPATSSVGAGIRVPLAVIDSSVPAADQLRQSFHRPHAAAWIDGSDRPLAAIAAAIGKGEKEAAARADSVHLFCHGEPGALHLGDAQVTLTTLSDDRASVAMLRRALAGRPLVLYGCSVGRDEIGRRFVDVLARALAAPVLASATPTGGRRNGGDWALTVAAGAAGDAFPGLVDPERAATWNGLLVVNVTNTAGDTSAGSLRAAATTASTPPTDQTVSFQNLGAGGTITLAGSPTFTLGVATSFNFSGTTTSLTISGSDFVADSHLYFSISAGQSLTLNSGLTFSAGSRIAAAQGGGTISFNGSLSGTSRVWVLGGSTAEIGTTTSTPLIDVAGNSTVRFTTGATYTSALEIEDTATIDTGANNVIISGVVSNDGTNTLAKTGTGTLTLSGTNTYSGTTTVSQGTLSVAADSNLGTGAITLNGGALGVTGATTIDNAITLGGSNGTINATANATFSGVVSGTGALTKSGASTLTLSGTNTYTGVTAISSGTLQLSGGSALADTAAVSIGAGATLDLNGTSETVGDIAGAGSVSLGAGTLTLASGSSTTFSGAISGTGGLTKTGASTLTLSGTNTYTGTTTISAGTLRLAGGAALADNGTVSVAAGATLDLNGTTETIGSLAGAGTVTLGAGSITQSNSSASTFSGTLSGSGTYTVASGSTLTGTGTYSMAVTIQSGGTIAPGNSPGTVSTGNLTLSSGSTASMELNGTVAGTGHDQIAVTGTVTVSGAMLNVALGYTPTVGDSYTLIANDGVDAVTGTFSGLAEGASFSAGGYSFRISYAGGTGNDVVLTALGPVASADSPSAAISGSAAGDRMFGSNSGDLIRSLAGSDTVLGLDGDDTLSGGAGLDQLQGNGGHDLIYGNTDGDILYGNTDGDTLFGGQATDDLYGGQGDDLLYGNRADDTIWGNLGNDTLYGGQEGDRLIGGSGADRLWGNLGDDTLSGGTGDDTLAGGGGADRLVFTDAGGADRILDFTIGEDLLAVSTDINGTGIATAADLSARAVDDGAGNTLVDLGGGNSVTLVGIGAAQISSDSFLIA